MSTQILTAEGLVVASAEPGLLVLDFWAPWCGPCKIIGPVFDKLAGRFSAHAKFAKVDVDAESSAAQRYNVRSVPTILVLRNGQVIDQIVGAAPESKITERLERALISA